MFWATNPAKVLAPTVLPRTLLQAFFFAELGRLVNGTSGAEYAFIGAAAFASTSFTIMGVSDIPITENTAGTYFRLQTSVLAPATTFLCRLPPYVACGALGSAVVIAVDGAALGLRGYSWSALEALPIYVLVSVSIALFGLAVSLLALGRSQDIFISNTASFAAMTLTGSIIPLPDGLHWLLVVAKLLPAYHGLAAVRAMVGSRPWGGQLLLEGAVAAGWLAVACALARLRDRNVRTS